LGRIVLSKLRILAQRLKQIGGQVSPVRIVAGVVLMGAGIVAAFGLAPGTMLPDTPTQLVRRDLTSPALQPLVRDNGYWREERIQRGDTMGSVLARLSCPISPLSNSCARIRARGRCISSSLASRCVSRPTKTATSSRCLT
jgi:hypothetical protein